MGINTREELLEKLENSLPEIKIKNSFKNFLDKIDFIIKENEIKKEVLEKVFDILDFSSKLKENKDPSTENITSIYSDSRWDWIKKLVKLEKDYIRYFFEEFDELEIDYKSLTWLLSQKSGLPNIEEIKNLKNFLDGKNKNLKKEEYIKFCSVSSMFKWKWIPRSEILEKIIDFSLEENMNFSSISLMQHWKWAPDLENLKILNIFLKKNNFEFKSLANCLSWTWLPKNKEFDDFMENLKNISDLIKNYDISFKSIMNMQASLGLPDFEKLKNFLEFCLSKKVSIKSICSMQSTKWIPNLELLENFINISNWKIESICSMQAGHWIPNLEKLKTFIKIIGSDYRKLREITWKQLWIDKSLKLIKKEMS